MPNVGPYIYDVSISGYTRSSIYIYIYDISSLRVNEAFCLFRISDFIKHITIEHNEELNYLYWSPDVSSVIKSRRKGIVSERRKFV